MKIKYAFLGLLISSSSVCFAEEIVAAKIKQINVDGENEDLYFLTEGKWSITTSTTCNPSYVVIKKSVPGRKEILAVALAAKYSGTPVQFYGTCSGDYFFANQILNK